MSTTALTDPNMLDFVAFFATDDRPNQLGMFRARTASDARQQVTMAGATSILAIAMTPKSQARHEAHLARLAVAGDLDTMFELEMIGWDEHDMLVRISA